MFRTLRFSTAQLMLLVAFFCLAAGTVSTAWRNSNFGGYSSLEFSPDGTKLLASDLDGTTLWNLQIDKPRPFRTATAAGALGSWHSRWIDNDTIFTAYYGVDSKKPATTMVLWDLRRNQAKGEVKVPYIVQTPAVASQARIVASFDYAANSIDVWDLDSGQKVQTLKFASPVQSCDVSPDGKTLAAMVNRGGSFIVEIVLSMISLFAVGPYSLLLWHTPCAAFGSCYGIWLGTIAVARGTSRNMTALHKTTTAQMINLVNCDVINLALGLIERQLLRSRDTARYLDLSG